MNEPREYKGHTITKLFPTGYYEAYVGGRFVIADTLAGIKETIRTEGN